MAHVQQYFIVSLFVVVGVLVGMDFISGLVEHAAAALSASITNH